MPGIESQSGGRVNVGVRFQLGEGKLSSPELTFFLSAINRLLAETSEFTAAFEGIARQQVAVGATESAPLADGGAHAESAPERDAWLSPVPDADVRAATASVVPTASAQRASDRGFLSITLDEYLELLDWTWRQVRADKRGAIRADLRPILERLHINADAWIDTIDRFGRAFRRVVGRVSSVAALASARGRHWYQGVNESRQAFG
jgi:hypothetical protein